MTQLEGIITGLGFLVIALIFLKAGRTDHATFTASIGSLIIFVSIALKD